MITDYRRYSCAAMNESRMQPSDSLESVIESRARLFGIIAAKSFGRRKITLASGRESDFYFDMKPTMFDPQGAALLPGLLLDKLDGLDADMVGGLAMGAVPLVATVCAASVAFGRPLPGFFVRKEVKDHGTQRRIDGADVKGREVVILEDVTTTGQSAMQAVEAVRAAGGNIAMVLTVVDREEGAAAFFRGERLPFDRLFSAGEFLKAKSA